MGTARAAAAAAAAGWLVAAGCSSTGRRAPAPPDPDLRVWAPPVVHWGASGRRMRFAVENATQRSVEVQEPDPGAARIDVFADAGAARVCGVDAASDPPSRGAVTLAPGDQVPVTVDLGDACGELRPGEYRYELTYRVANAGGVATALHTRYGTVVVEALPRAAGRRPRR